MSVWKWRQQQQRQQQDTQRGSKKPLAEHSQGKRTGKPNPRGTWKPIVEEEHYFEVELRIQRTPQDAVREDQGRLTKKKQDLVDKLRTEYRTESVIADWGRQENSTDSTRNPRQLRKFGNIELFELGETSKTIQCQTCLKYSLEGLIYCSCGVCRRQNREKELELNLNLCLPRDV